MKAYNTLPLTLAALLATSGLHAITILDSGHTDVGIAYEDGEWNLHAGVHGTGGEHIEYDPADVVFYGNDDIRITLSGSSSLSFLGEAGDNVWIFPQTQETDILFLGLSTEEITSGLFSGDITLTLDSVSGPGDFILYQFSGSEGVATVYLDSSDGVGDSMLLSSGTHAHYNWAFTEEGLYSVTFQASGILSDGNVFTESGLVTYTFGINQVPEPSTYALIAGGLALGLVIRQRRRR